MNVWPLRVRKPYFEAILEEEKTIEGRPPKSSDRQDYSEIEDGDILYVWTGDWSEDSLKYAFFEAEGNQNYRNVTRMLLAEGTENVLPGADSMEEVTEKYYDISGYTERIGEHGINGFEIGDRL